MKKVLSILLTVLMLLGTVSFTVLADATSLPAAQDGIITLSEDVILPSDTRFNDAMTIDLNGNTLYITNCVTFNADTTISNGTINADNQTSADGIIRADYHHGSSVELELNNVTVSALNSNYATGVFYLHTADDTLILDNVDVTVSGANDDPGSGVFYSPSSFDRGSVTLKNETTLTTNRTNAIFFAAEVDISDSTITCTDVKRPVFRQANGEVENSTITVNSIEDGRAVIADVSGQNSGVITFIDSDVIVPDGTTMTDFSNEGSFVLADHESNVGNGEGISTAVAAIDGFPYATLEDALTDAAAMNDAVTITLLDNVGWVTGAGHGSTPFVPETSSSVITIEGNDFTITATGAGVGSIRAANGTLLTFNNVNFVDESVSYAESAWEFTYLEFAGKLKFTDCDFKDEIQIDSDNNSSPITESEFTNCTFESNESSVYAVWFGNGSGKFDTCTFTGYRGLKMHEAYGSDINAVTVENCTFNNITAKPAIAIGDLNALTEVNIKNCTVNNAQAGDQNAYLLETDTTVDTFTFVAQNNTITVDGNTITPIVKIGANEYPTIEEAIAVASTNDVIDIFNNTAISDSDAATLSGKSVIIDLNGKALTINSATDYSDLISIPKGYKIKKTAISDSEYTYTLKKIVKPSPVGVVIGGGGIVNPDEYTITFDTNGGSKVSSAKVNKGEAAVAPVNPEKEGYTFDGWYADKNFKTLFDFKAEITKNMTLYAKWIDVKENETADSNKKEIILTIGDTNINLFGNNIENDVAPKLVSNRTMLPARIIAESLGSTVTWTAEEPNKVLIEKGDTVIIITIGDDTATVNGEEITLGSPAFIENDRTYIPTRFLSEKLGAIVEWIPETSQVIITVTE